MLCKLAGIESNQEEREETTHERERANYVSTKEVWRAYMDITDHEAPKAVEGMSIRDELTARN